MSTRREFLTLAGIGTAAMAAKGLSAAPLNPLPRWRGFVTPFGGLAQPGGSASPVNLEDDCRMIRDFGFDFIRPTFQYWDWVQYTDKSPIGGPLAKDLLKIKESGLVQIDKVIDLGRSYGLHVSLCMSRAPGYNFREAVMGQDNEPFDLWTDKVAHDAFVFYWDTLAKRYREISPKWLSFDLLNEPIRDLPNHPAARATSKPSTLRSALTRGRYQSVVTMATEKIRETSPDRMILAEGLNKVATCDDILQELIPLRVAQSMHCKAPFEVTHYRSWLDANQDFPTPDWPAKKRDGSGTFGRDELEELYKPWAWLITQDVGVHCGEFGVVSTTPRNVGMKWLCDVLDVLKARGIGWTYSALRGPWGLLDSNRSDAIYMDVQGHKVDRELLTLLQYH